MYPPTSGPITVGRVAFTAVVMLAAACSGRSVNADSSDADRAHASVPALPASAPPAAALAERRTVPVAADSIPLDSCAKLDRLAREQAVVRQADDPLSPKRPGSWTDTRVDRAVRFTIEVPRAAEELRVVAHPAGDTTWAISGFPYCRYYCALSVEFRPLSPNTSAEAYEAGQRAAHDPNDEEAEAWAPGPWRPLTVDGEPGGLVDIPCGDCTSMSVYTARAGTLATIELSVDDRDGYQPGLLCRLARVAQTFQWVK
jgi:hypothetical protein